MLTIPPVIRRGRLGRRVAPLAVTAVAAAGLLASCAATSTQAASIPGGAATTAATAASSASDGQVSTVSGTDGLAACQPGALLIAIDANAAGAAAGSTYYPLNFTNTSGLPCSLYGYPGVSLVTAGGTAGRQIGVPAQRDPAFAKQPVRLNAGGVAHAWLQVAQAGNYPPSACKPMTVHWLRVYAPGQRVALYVNHTFGACAAASAPLLTVMPVRAGQGVKGKTP